MLEFFQTLSWAAVFQIILIDILLGGDNAVVIALACRNLPPKQRMQGILWGTAGAIILRVVLIAFALTLLNIPFLKIVGGALLLVGMVAAIALTLRQRRDAKYNDPSAAVRVRAKDRFRMVKMKAQRERAPVAEQGEQK